MPQQPEKQSHRLLLRIHTQHIPSLRISAAFAGEGDQEIVAALPTTRPSEAVGQDAALQEAAQLPLGVRRDALVLPVVPAQGKEGLEVVLHRPVER